VAELLGQHLAHLQQPGAMAMPGAVEKLPSAGPVRKRRRVGLVAGCLLLLALGGGLFLAYRAGWLSRSPDSSHSQQPGRGPLPEKGGVAPEVLDELRRLVTAQEEHFRIAQANFEYGRGSPLDFTAAAVLLIEARVRLATAEGKSVIALLEDLVRNREEENPGACQPRPHGGGRVAVGPGPPGRGPRRSQPASSARSLATPPPPQGGSRGDLAPVSRLTGYNVWADVMRWLDWTCRPE
jgi:hypothetical protein